MRQSTGQTTRKSRQRRDPGIKPAAQCHHDVGIENAVNRIEQLIRKQGLKSSATRRRVLRYLLALKRPIKAYDLMKKFSEDNRAIKAASMYRILRFLSAKGYIHKIETLNAYVINGNPEYRGNEFLAVCTVCGRTREFYDSLVDRRLKQHSEKLGFAVQKQTVEIIGRCVSGCR
jgi:Fur family transcriptional regulator, zinc uptake regulator